MRKFRVCLVFLLLVLAQHLFAISPEDYFKAGLNLYSQKQYEQSIAYFKMTVQLDPRHWRAYQSLGTSYYHLNLIPDALAALNKSLALHPDNPTLKQFIASIQASHPDLLSLPETTPTLNAPVTSATKPSDPSALEQENEVVSWPRVLRFNFATTPESNSGEGWLKFYGGYNHSDMTDLSLAVRSWNDFYQGSGIPSSATEDYNGFVIGTEGGIMLDKGNALSLSMDGLFSGNYQAQADPGTGQIIQTIDPLLLALSFNYYHYFYQKQNRFYFGAGAGYGEAIVHYVGPYYPSNVETIADLYAGTFVGTVQVGEELLLSPHFTLEFSVKGRYAHISTISGGLPSGSASLRTVPAGMTFLWDDADANKNGFGNTFLDFTGPDVKISFNFYF